MIERKSEMAVVILDCSEKTIAASTVFWNQSQTFIVRNDDADARVFKIIAWLYFSRLRDWQNNKFRNLESTTIKKTNLAWLKIRVARW
jgi:hypothetical protein